MKKKSTEFVPSSTVIVYLKEHSTYLTEDIFFRLSKSTYNNNSETGSIFIFRQKEKSTISSLLLLLESNAAVR